MNVLSLFDGMSCGQIALRELGFTDITYYAAEIDKFAIAQTKLNFPDTIHLGSVTEVRTADLPPIDLLIGGSPCQGFSLAGHRLNFNDPRSALIKEYFRIWEEVQTTNPHAKFLLENVVMDKSCEYAISEELGLYPVKINSSLVSAQNRVRLYWSNIKVRKDGLFGDERYTDIPQPRNKHLFLSHILEENPDERYTLSAAGVQWLHKHIKKRNRKRFVRYPNEKALTLTVSNCTSYHVDANIVPTNKPPRPGKSNLRKLTPTECARLQTIPEWYKWTCSPTQQYKMLGNGWTIEVIKHIFSYLPQYKSLCS